ncbi:MAG: sterol desaturase family protein [Halioglobus sp.]|nr:sterol desaturase family protein [Halioglobus sp.]
MTAWLLDNEPQLRLGIFLSVLALLIIVQRVRPRREVTGGWQRSLTNLLLIVAGTLILRLAFPLLAFDLALRLEPDGGGLNRVLPYWAAVATGMLVLDFAIYWQHRLLHVIPPLWRLHRVHHADTGFDATTAVRFHPFEIALSMLIKLGLIALFGIPALAVLFFEILLSAGALFTHANIRLPDVFERRLRWLLVTPEMHRIHHSVHKEETNSNYGFHLSIWDRIFGSYRDEPRDGQTTMQIGLHEFRGRDDQTLWALLINPFRSN